MGGLVQLSNWTIWLSSLHLVLVPPPLRVPQEAGCVLGARVRLMSQKISQETSEMPREPVNFTGNQRRTTGVNVYLMGRVGSFDVTSDIRKAFAF